MVRMMLRFDNEKVHEPVTSQVILEEKIPLNIMSAYVNQQGGEILIDVDSEHAERLAKAFRKRGVTVDVPKLIEKDEVKCTSCGACVSLCPMNALKYDPSNKVELNEAVCNGITCGLCVDACPVRAIRLLG
ncbi:4Fe-4S dicluster domain-containing protein [Candidatus Bathyarchaeota archaeon]|nr:4Fe-4S dicluster domain-containing protein [Candidatus Bathyarchaeota archaeon]